MHQPVAGDDSPCLVGVLELWETKSLPHPSLNHFSILIIFNLCSPYSELKLFQSIKLLKIESNSKGGGQVLESKKFTAFYIILMKYRLSQSLSKDNLAILNSYFNYRYRLCSFKSSTNSRIQTIWIISRNKQWKLLRGWEIDSVIKRERIK